MENIFHDVPAVARQEIFTDILQGNNFRLERIVSYHQATPPGQWLVQEHNEWVILLKGSALIKFQASGQERRLSPGDYLNIPAQTPHRVEWTDKTIPTVWLALHYS